MFIERVRGVASAFRPRADLTGSTARQRAV